MEDLVPIYVSTNTASRLEKLALIGGSVGTVIERLLVHWQTTAAAPSAPQQSNDALAQEMWKTPHGDLLPVGQQLVATYKGQRFVADIEHGGLRLLGRLYPSPSAAGKAVKESLKVTGSAAITDGRTFWKLQDPTTGGYVSIANLHPGEPIDTAKILAELRARATSSAA